MDWPLGEAKNKFSEVFERALKDGPQRVSRRGKDRVVVVAEAEYDRLKGRKGGKKPDFIEFLLSGRGLGAIETPARSRGKGRAPARRIRF